MKEFGGYMWELQKTRKGLWLETTGEDCVRHYLSFQKISRGTDIEALQIVAWRFKILIAKI